MKLTPNASEASSNRKNLIPPSHSSPDFSTYPQPVPYPQPHSKQAAAAEPRSAAEPAHSGFLEPPVHYPLFPSASRHPPSPQDSSRHDDDMLRLNQSVTIITKRRKNDAVVLRMFLVSKEATTHTILQTVRLVINLLQHKVIKTTLAQFADVQIHGLDIVMTCRMLHNRSRITGDTLRTQPRHR